MQKIEVLYGGREDVKEKQELYLNSSSTKIFCIFSCVKEKQELYLNRCITLLSVYLLAVKEKQELYLN